jgi:transcriptional regulator with PAS, ATPase and Fis domain
VAKVLVSWIGATDLRASEGKGAAGKGPIGRALSDLPFDRAVLLCNYSGDAGKQFKTWVREGWGVPVELTMFALRSPTDFEDIYRASSAVLDGVKQAYGADIELFLHLSPGTPSMAAVWLLLGKSRFSASFIQSSPEAGTEVVEIPFDIAADFLPDLLNRSDRKLRSAASLGPEEGVAFESIVHRCDQMKRLLWRAHRVSLRNVPVLIAGETGTGKELLARAIHAASPRANAPFVAVNCGAIPSELVESELFGHKKGAFTGATRDHVGYIEASSGGTLFLDEFGELPLSAQVKLLRVLQEDSVVPVGQTQPRSVDLRVVAATNRDLPEEIRAGRFREDLYYRMAVGVLALPPLRERPGDTPLLVDSLLEELNVLLADQPGHVHKELSVRARELIVQHSWPGNIRELRNVLLRALVWTEGRQIQAEDVVDAMSIGAPARAEQILGRRIEEGIDLKRLMTVVASHYLERALDASGGNKTAAASLVGLPSYQTFTNWYDRYVNQSGTQVALD